jgi:hypothetical protein
MRRPGPDEWLKLLSEYATSGLSQKEFVAKHDLSFSTFQYWLYRASKKKKTESGLAPRFLPVEVVSVAAPKARQQGAALLEADLRSGVTVRFPVGTDVGYLAELLAALG